MPRLVGLIVSIALVLPATAASLEGGDSWAEVLAAGQGTLKVAFVEAAAVPSTDPLHWSHSFEPDLVAELVDYLQREHGVTVRVETVGVTGFNAFLDAVAAAGDGVIGLSQITILPERRQRLDFSVPYISNLTVLVSAADRAELASTAEVSRRFAGLHGVTMSGTSHERALVELKERSMPSLRIDYVPSVNEVVAEVADPANRAFSFVDYVQYWNFKKSGYELQRHGAFDRWDGDCGAVLPKGSDWKEPLDAFFGTFVGSRAYDRLLEGHFGWELGMALEVIDRQKGASSSSS